MAFTDLYQIKDHQSFDGQALLNVYQCEKLNPAFDADDVLFSYLDTVVPLLLIIQPIVLTHTSFECQSVSDPLDFATGTITPNAGLLAGQALTNFTSAAIQFNRLRTDMKNGQKRWAAGTETQIAGNGWEAGFRTDLDDLGQVIINNWERDADPGVPVASYCIVKRVCETTDPAGKCIVYRLPEDQTEYVSYFPTSFIVRTNARSQVSRKVLL